ncbi:MAG: ABC transporter ATP-binding protein [Gemmatimonadota bacterium]
MEPALLLEGVSKHYSGHTAVDRLDLVVAPGSVHGLLGPNGAGKSTTLRMVMNILLRDEGRVLVLGRDPERDRSVLRRVGYLPEERGLYQKMKTLQTVVFFGRLKGLHRAEATRRGREWLDRLGLADWADEKIESLSKGMQQKAQFIATVLHEPELLILDEPQSGLDPVNQEVMAETIRAARDEGRAVVLSTHNMPQAEELCDQVTLIADGRKVLEGEVRALRSQHRTNLFRVTLEDEAADAGLLDGGSLVHSATRKNSHQWELELAPGRTRADLLRALVEAGLPMVRFEHVEPTLHEIFLHHVGAGAPRAARREVARA